MRLIALLLIVLPLIAAVPATAQSSANLAVNYSFEQGFDVYDGGDVAKGWTAYKLSGSLSFRDTAGLSPGFVEKIEGGTSQTLWSDGSSFVAGIYQRRGVTAGKFYRAWFATAAKVKGGGPMVRTIGLDPTGGADPTAASVVWGSRYDGEKWATIEQGNAPVVRAAATGDRMTVFLKVENGGGGQNQAYLDAVFLLEDGDAPGAVQQPATGNPPGGGTGNPEQAPSATALPPTRPPGTEGRNDYQVEGGWFYSQANGRDAGGIYGYTVTDADGVPFWTWLQRFGGVSVVGYPVSHRFQWEGFTSQAFQKVVFQYRPDQGGAVVFVNAFDQLSKAGKDDWLLTVRNVPKSNDWQSDNGKDWPAVVQNHQAILDPFPALKSAYLASPDPVTQFGLPMGIQEFSNVIVVRAQRTVFQQWKIDVPWARSGQVVLANGGDVVKESGILPGDVIGPQPYNYKPATLPAVNLTPAQPAATATSGPATPAATNTPAPAGNLAYNVESVTYLPNCALTQLRVYVKDAGGGPVNGLIAQITWAGNERPLRSEVSGKPGQYDPGWTDIILQQRTIQQNWTVTLWEGTNQVGGPVDVQSTDSCQGPEAKQIMNVTFRRK
ncbi:MAG: hypothetical protein U0556_02365 [Dehalococcoidia bacterium]